jgi:F0F1-type ATP synthase membrane subunit b/b'
MITFAALSPLWYFWLPFLAALLFGILLGFIIRAICCPCRQTAEDKETQTRLEAARADRSQAQAELTRLRDQLGEARE